MQFSVQDLFGVNPQFYADMFTFTKEILNGKVHFCALICPSKQTENYYEEENNLFFKNYFAFIIHSSGNLQIFLPLGVYM